MGLAPPTSSRPTTGASHWLTPAPPRRVPLVTPRWPLPHSSLATGRKQRAAVGMRSVWLGLAWLLLGRPACAGYPHLEGDVRWRRLFAATRFFLRVDSGGRVAGTRWRHGLDSVLEIRSIRVGVVVLKAAHSGFYVAMNRRGRLFGSPVYTVHCKFRERIEENGFNTYASLRWRHRGRPMFLALDGRGAPRRGGRTRRRHVSTHFLPVLLS